MAFSNKSNRLSSAVVLWFLLATPTFVWAGSLTVAWDPSPDPDVVAYVVGWGLSESTDWENVGDVTSYRIEGLVAGLTYNVVVRALTADGRKSGPSNVASGVAGASSPPPLPDPPPPPSGLVGAWAFDEGARGTLTDLSGNGNHGSKTGAKWTDDGRYGSALVFDGHNALVTVPDAATLRLTKRVTLEAWIKPSRVDDAWRPIIYKGDNYDLMATSPEGTAPAGGVRYNWGGRARVYGTAAIAVNTWTHLAFTNDGAGVLRLYVNGVLTSTTLRKGNLWEATRPLEIGGDTRNGRYFAGVIDELRIYNRVLTKDEIQADMNRRVSSTVQSSTSPNGTGVTSTTSAYAGPPAPDPTVVRAVRDFDADVKDDLGIYRGSSGEWQVRGSSGLELYINDRENRGPGVVPVAADYDGDGVADIASWNPIDGRWVIYSSGNDFRWTGESYLGSAQSIPAPADFDGDGAADIAVFRDGVWATLDGQLGQFGRAGDVPIPHDYDGDGAADLAVFRPTDGTWSVMDQFEASFGQAGDVPVPADYDGDTRVDLAVYRPSTSTWYVRGQFQVPLGQSGDVPVPLDTNGDGRAELVVYRPSDGTWLLFDPLTGVTDQLLYGKPGDVPVGAAHLFVFDSQAVPGSGSGRD